MLPFLILLACNTSRMTGTTEGKYLYQKIKKLKKNPSDEKLKREISTMYEVALNQHRSRLSALESITDVSRFDRIVAEYYDMQKMSDFIRVSPAADFIPVTNYFDKIEETKELAAAEMYQQGLNNLRYNDRSNLKKAWNNFRKATYYIPGYKDAEDKMDEAFELATIHIVVNPVQFENPFRRASSADFMIYQLPEKIVTDLGSRRYSGVPAKYYTNKTTSRDIDDYQELNLLWNTTQVHPSRTQKYSRNVSKQVKKGVDTAGHPIFETVNAVIHIEKKNLIISGGVSYRFVDGITGDLITSGTVQSQHTKFFERAKYTGDQRALSKEDWNLINNSNYNFPSTVDMEDDLYRNIYADLIARIRNEVDW